MKQYLKFSLSMFSHHGYFGVILGEAWEAIGNSKQNVILGIYLTFIMMMVSDQILCR